MLTTEQKRQFNNILKHLSDALDITESQYKIAEERYKSLGEFLQEEDTLLSFYHPEVYPQGSFRLGTVIRPLGREDEFDLDLVCNLETPPNGITQCKLKQLIGDRLKDRDYYKRMLEKEGNRCWTLKYTEEPGFHMDVLPAIPDQHTFILESVVEKDVLQHAIRITDKRNQYYPSNDINDWPKSNPIGYAEWFKEKMILRFREARILLAESLKMSVEELPDWRVKTPLQRAIQIMKRHRNIMFGDDKDKPISIIITTLAAKAYDQEDNIYDALLNLLNNMPDYIEYPIIDGKKEAWVANPVNPYENFADKWKIHHTRKDNFFYWIEKAKVDLIDLIGQKGIKESYEILKGTFGSHPINEAFRRSGQERIINESSIQTSLKIVSNTIVSHKQKPLWAVIKKNKVEVFIKYKNGANWFTVTNSTLLPKNCEIKFIATTDTRKPFCVYWQVVNTGSEAIAADDLRGAIFPAKIAGAGGLKHTEITRYKGTHWIECFVVKDDVCIAKSNEFFVNVD